MTRYKILLVLGILASCHQFGAGQDTSVVTPLAPAPAFGEGSAEVVSPLATTPSPAPAAGTVEAVTPLAPAAETPTVSPLAPAVSPAVQNITQDLEPFTAIQACVPFSIAIAPGNYSVTAVAEGNVLDSLSFIEENGTLQISTDGNFSTTQAVKVAIFLPEDSLESLVVTSVGEVTVLPGFSAPMFVLSSAFGTGNIYVLGFDTDMLNVETSGTGTIIVNGTIGTADISASGTAAVYVLTVNTSATVSLAGTANVALGTASALVPIDGQASGINTVAYRRGVCNVQSPFLGVFTPCNLVRTLNVPAIDPLWTCGLAVLGNFTCPIGGAAAVRSGATAGVSPAVSPAPSTGPATTVQPLPTASPPPSPTILPSIASLTQGVGGQQVISSGPGLQTATAMGAGSQTAISNSNSNAFSAAMSTGRKLRQAFASAGGGGAFAGPGGTGAMRGPGAHRGPRAMAGAGAFAGPGAFAGLPGVFPSTGAGAFAGAGAFPAGTFSSATTGFTTNTLPVGSSIATGLNQAIVQSLQCSVDASELNVLTSAA